MLVGLCSCTQVPAGTPNIETNQNVVFTGKKWSNVYHRVYLQESFLYLVSL